MAGAGYYKTITINGYQFRDVTNETCAGPIMSWWEAFYYTLGKYVSTSY